MWQDAILWCYVEGVSTVKVAARAAIFTVLTPYNVAPQYHNLPHPTLPANIPHMQQHVVFSPDDGHKDARNMSRL